MFAILLHENMNPFYENISSFPTVFFTFFLAIVTLYWLVAVLGFVEIDVLDFDIPDADGTLDVNSGHGLETPDVLAGLMLKMGLQGVPVTIIISFVALIGWMLCYYAVHFLFPVVPEGILRWLAGIPVLLASLYIGTMITALTIKPLRPLFKKASQETIKNVLGQTVVVRTPKVTPKRGEANLEDGGAGLILKVRSSEGEEFVRGDRLVLLEYNSGENTYRVISEDEFNNINH